MPNATPFEKEEMRACDDLVRQHDGEIVSFSQPRATKQTAGIPDRRYRVFGTAFWWEVKSQDPNAQLTADQADFLLAELNAGVLAVCGTVHDLALFLPVVRAHESMMLVTMRARAIVDRWIRRGFRRTTKQRRAG
jgi:hypothetical protein